MSEPTIIPATIGALGVTIFGVSTGLDPAILIAGFAGGVWAQSYGPPANVIRRMSTTMLSSVLAGYLAPVIAAGVISVNLLPATLSVSSLQLPVAVLVGLTAHKVLGPALIRYAAKRAEKETPK